MVKVKICGITNLEDALAAVRFGADTLGFVFFKESPRYISPEDAGKIIGVLPPFVTTVGVFVDETPKAVDRIMKLVCLDVAQFHGNEPPTVCAVAKKSIKAIRVNNLRDLEPLKRYSVSAYLLDTYSPDSFGGTGQVFNWDIAVEAKQFGRIILSGGLTPENVTQAVRHVHPYAVDVSSGVESDKGKKDHEKLREFINNAKGWSSLSAPYQS